MWQVFLKILLIFPHRVTAVTLSLCFNPGCALEVTYGFLGTTLEQGFERTSDLAGFHVLTWLPLVLCLVSFFFHSAFNSHPGPCETSRKLNKKPPLRRRRLCQAEGLAESTPDYPLVVRPCAVDTLNAAALFVLAFFLHLRKL